MSATENTPAIAPTAATPVAKPVAPPAAKPVAKAVRKAPLKAAPKAQAKAPVKASAKAPAQAVVKTVRKATSQVPAKASVASPVKAVVAVPVVKPVRTKPAKVKKPKMVRDSLNIPKPEYAVLDVLKLRATRLAHPAKKTELIRAGIKAIAAMSDAAFLAALQAVPSLKTGRPAKSKSA